MKKGIIIIAILLIVSAVAWFVIRPMIEPEFGVLSYDGITMEGKATFSGEEFTISYRSNENIQVGRNGYVVKWYFKDKDLYFDLYKNDKFIKNLQIIKR